LKIVDIRKLPRQRAVVTGGAGSFGSRSLRAGYASSGSLDHLKALRHEPHFRFAKRGITRRWKPTRTGYSISRAAPRRSIISMIRNGRCARVSTARCTCYTRHGATVRASSRHPRARSTANLKCTLGTNSCRVPMSPIGPSVPASSSRDLQAIVSTFHHAVLQQPAGVLVDAVE